LEKKTEERVSGILNYRGSIFTNAELLHKHYALSGPFYRIYKSYSHSR